MVSLATSISVLIWAFLLQKPHIDASRTMSSAITKPMILPLDGVNYQSWKSIMKSYLRSVDLWLLTGETSSACTNRPVSANANAPTADETCNM
jgi:hypothetical protein